MRAALKEAIIRWEWWIASDANARSRVEEALVARCEALGLSFRVILGQDTRALALLTSWELGSDARQEHKDFSCSAAFRALAPLLERQVEVRLLATRDLHWGDLATLPEAAFVEVTRDVIPDVTRKRGGRAPLPGRDEIPALAQAQIWPVIGHLGRLLAMMDAATMLQVRASLVEAWGPLAEPPRLWQ